MWLRLLLPCTGVALRSAPSCIFAPRAVPAALTKHNGVDSHPWPPVVAGADAAAMRNLYEELEEQAELAWLALAHVVERECVDCEVRDAKVHQYPPARVPRSTAMLSVHEISVAGV